MTEKIIDGTMSYEFIRSRMRGKNIWQNIVMIKNLEKE